MLDIIKLECIVFLYIITQYVQNVYHNRAVVNESIFSYRN